MFKSSFSDIKDHFIKLLANTLHGNFGHEIKLSWAIAAIKVWGIGLYPHPPHVPSNLVA